jgi:hypothetical protein
MRKFAIRLLTLSMYATALVVVPMVAPATAATDSSTEVKKHKKKIHRSPRVDDARSSSQARPSLFPSMYEDPDRKAAGGGY